MLNQIDTNPSLNDIIFKNKNRAYGAYELRNGYSSTLGKAMVVGISVLAGAYGLSCAYDKLFPPLVEEAPTIVTLEPLHFNVPARPIQQNSGRKPNLPNSSKSNIPTIIVEDEKFQEKDIKENSSIIEQSSNDLGIIGSDNDAPLEIGVDYVDGSGGGVPSLGEPPKAETESNDIFIAVESAPQFPDGGLEAFGKFLSKNLIYTDEALENQISGKVILKFTVNRDGSLQDIVVQKGVGFGLDEEAIRVLKLSPKWTPGKQSGKPVRVSFSVPIVFSLPTD
ncbi:MAG: energy transducer TonB [Pseudarcicella sp.]|nr:energy transducer TonB [Pseudarcicella sp.]MBP6409521.1 energy transducer TonB [Pseudarcicella sp.]